jgi:predicted DNA-binding protein with PD1-like motif
MTLQPQPIAVLPLRLRPGDDLRRALEAAVAAQGHAAAFVLSGIGSLSQTRLRLAGADAPLVLEGDVEILTLSGSVGVCGSHLHMSVADAQGRVTGGHVAPGCTVRTTAEVLLAALPHWHFAREFDAQTGFDELVARRT